MNIIVVVDKNWGIGYKNKLLARNPVDLIHFKSITLDKVVVMGRKTLESLPGGLPLKQRKNVVLTTDKYYQVPDALVLNSVKELEEELIKYNSEDIFIIGGESIYKEFLQKCQTAYITKMENTFQADTWFPNLDKLTEWKMISESEEHTHNDLKFKYTIYKQD